MAYTPPEGNITSMNQILQWTNSLVDEMLFPALLGAIFFIIFIRLLYTTNETGRAFASASFICMVIGIFLRAADLINNMFMVIFIILTVIGAIWMHTENAKFG